MTIPRTLTEAQLQGGFVFVYGQPVSQATFRTVPYAERYRAHTAIVESPAEQIQRAAEDEKQRRAGAS